MSDRMFNGLHFSTQGLLRAGAGLALMVLGSAAMAQSVANGKILYVQKACASSGCHEADPSRNANGTLTAAFNNGVLIQSFCESGAEMIPICSVSTTGRPSSLRYDQSGGNILPTSCHTEGPAPRNSAIRTSAWSSANQ